MIDLVYVGIAISVLLMYFLNGNKRLPPGPLMLPVLGTAIQIYRADPKYPHKDLAKFAEIYGDIISFGFGMKTAVVVSSYDTMRELFKLHDTNISRFEFSFVNDRNYGKNLGIIWSHGRDWAEVRAFTKKSLRDFGYGKMLHMNQSLGDSANQLVDTIRTELLDSIDGTFTVTPKKFAVHVLNVVWDLVGGYKFDPNDKLLKKNMACVDKAVLIYGKENPYNVYPFLKNWFPNLVQYPEHLKILEEIHGFSKYLINDAIERQCQRLDSEPTSFIEVFVDQIDECRGDPETPFTQDQLEVILEDLFLGSLETSGTLVCWSILFMVLNPDIQIKVRQEVLDKMASKQGDLSTTELKRLPYVKATVLEILRLGNVVPLPAPRSVTRDLKIRDYIIPKGSILFCNLHAIYNEKDYWKDPATFRPERFLNENGEIDQSRSEKILKTVFGIGPRMCFGDDIGLGSLFTFFAAVMINFKFDVAPGQEPPSADNPHSGLVDRPRDFSVKVTKLT